MGATISCKYCEKEFAKNQIIYHQIRCAKEQQENKVLKECDVCHKTFMKKEYFDHVLSHYQNDSSKEKCSNKGTNPSVNFCEYYFSSSKIQRVTRIR